jgi:hypothetical protein
LILAFLGSLATVAPLRAETVSFPKENPVLTFELPKDWKATLTKHHTLLLVAQAESKIFIVQEMPAVHDKESAEKYLVGDLNRDSASLGISDLECWSDAYPASGGVAYLTANCTGKQYACVDKVSAENFCAGFSADGKRFFQTKAFGNSPGSFTTMEPILGSIKAIK